MDEALPKLAAALAGRYVPERELGAGGMATVYLAHDVRHDRQVALKVLRPELAAVIGAERFLAEIKTTANLQHPHILPLFDSGTVEGTVFYVMPYVEGESLRNRLRRERQLPVADALRIATEVAGALDYAHRHGIIHRDIKPENILLHDGSAVVADFGIALAVSRSEGGTRLTETGLSLGTPSYMSPEQAMGERNLDARSDVYALACVVYEMLTGEPPFSGSSAQVVVAKVLTEKPTSIRALRDTVPEGLERTVLTALAKLPADRFASAADFAAALTSPTAPPVGTASSARSAGVGSLTVRARRLGVPLLAGVALLAGAAGWLLRGVVAPARSAPPAAVRFTFELGDPNAGDAFISISPEGRRVIQARTDSAGVPHVVERDLGSTQVTLIQGTEGAEYPRFSPDGRWITFQRANAAWKVPATGGPATEVADSVNDVGEGWMPDGSILVTRNNTGIWRIPPDGAAPTQLTQIDTARQEFLHWSPQVLPGGHAFVFTNYATPVTRSRIEAYAFATRKRTVLVENAVYPRYADGRLFWMRAGAIWTVAFDPGTLRTSGTPVPVQDDVSWIAPDATAGYDVAPDGTLVFVRASQWGARSRIVWVDRMGGETPALPDTGAFVEPRLSPDGRWIVLTGTEPKRDLWLYDVRRDVLTQLTHAASAAFNAIWMPDSRGLIYTFEDPVYDLHHLTIDESAPDRAVVSSSLDKYASAVSPDGRLLAFSQGPGFEIEALSDTAAAVAFGPPSAKRASAAFSPDGRWITYQETSNGQSEVYLSRADGSGGRRVVSAGGGAEPLWTRGGREIVYRNGDAFMTAPVTLASGDVGAPVVLFRVKVVPGLDGKTRAFDVTPDGNRFLLAVPAPRPDARPVEVVMNWVAGLDATTKR
jgi:Tol biopolymer transport system component